MSPQPRETKEKNKWDDIKLKKLFSQQRKPSTKWKDNPLSGRIYSPMTHLIKVDIQNLERTYSPVQCDLVGALSHNQNIAGSFPSHGTCLGCRFDPWSPFQVWDLWFLVQNHVEGNESMLFSHFIVSLSLSYSLSNSNEKNVLLRWGLKKEEEFIKLNTKNKNQKKPQTQETIQLKSGQRPWIDT